MDVMPISALRMATGHSEPLADDPTNAALDAVSGFAQALQEAEDQARSALTSGTDPHDLVAALSESRLAVDTVVAVRDKVVEAYQEILRMPV